MSTTELRYQRFDRSHYAAYRRWFASERIRAALYDIDGDWLDFVLHDTTGAEYVAYRGQEMVAVVGILFPQARHSAYVITSIAVAPDRFGQGIGAVVLRDLRELHPLTVGQHWAAFVETQNIAAQRFFTKNGWYMTGLEEGMLTYTWQPT